MKPRPFQSTLRRAALGGAVAVLWLVGATPLDAALTSPQYVAVYRPLIVIKCPSLAWLHARPKNLGYLPAIGPNELRWQEAAPPTPTPHRDVVMLYDPPPEKPVAEAAPVEPPKVAAPEPKPAEPQPAKPTNTGGSPLRPEDILPFFEKPADVIADRPSDGDLTPFVPARPVQAPSKAIFLQK